MNPCNRITREDIDLILDTFEVRGGMEDSVNLLRAYLNRQEDYIKALKKEETPLFGEAK